MNTSRLPPLRPSGSTWAIAGNFWGKARLGSLAAWPYTKSPQLSRPARLKPEWARCLNLKHAHLGGPAPWQEPWHAPKARKSRPPPLRKVLAQAKWECFNGSVVETSAFVESTDSLGRAASPRSFLESGCTLSEDLGPPAPSASGLSDFAVPALRGACATQAMKLREAALGGSRR